VGSKDASFLQRVRFGRWRSSKVDDFGTNRKRVCDFLLVGHCDYGPILHRFWDTVTYWLKIAYFPTPLSFGAPLPKFPLQFRGEVSQDATRVIGLSSVKTTWSTDHSWSRFGMIPDCDGQTVSQNLSYSQLIRRCNNNYNCSRSHNRHRHTL